MLTFFSEIVLRWIRNSCRCHESPFDRLSPWPRGVWTPFKSEHLYPIFKKIKSYLSYESQFLTHLGSKWLILTFFQVKMDEIFGLEIFLKLGQKKDELFWPTQGAVKLRVAAPLVIHHLKKFAEVRQIRSCSAGPWRRTIGLARPTNESLVDQMARKICLKLKFQREILRPKMGQKWQKWPFLASNRTRVRLVYKNGQKWVKNKGWNLKCDQKLDKVSVIIDLEKSQRASKLDAFLRFRV